METFASLKSEKYRIVLNSADLLHWTKLFIGDWLLLQRAQAIPLMFDNNLHEQAHVHKANSINLLCMYMCGHLHMEAQSWCSPSPIRVPGTELKSSAGGKHFPAQPPRQP